MTQIHLKMHHMSLKDHPKNLRTQNVCFWQNWKMWKLKVLTLSSKTTTKWSFFVWFWLATPKKKWQSQGNTQETFMSQKCLVSIVKTSFKQKSSLKNGWNWWRTSNLFLPVSLDAGTCLPLSLLFWRAKSLYFHEVITLGASDSVKSFKWTCKGTF